MTAQKALDFPRDGEAPKAMFTPELEQISLDRLIPYARNARTHSPGQVAQIAASIREFGFTNPVLVDADDGIIAGHGRVLAARKLKMTEVPSIRLPHLNEAQKRAYVIADNKLALNAGWDAEMLSAELIDLRDLSFNLGLTGFTSDEIGALLAGTQGLTDPDAVPEPPLEPITRLGDVWLLGRHRPTHVSAASLISEGFDLRYQIIWRKQHFSLSRGDYHWQHEPCWYAVRKGATSHWQGSRKESSVWEITNGTGFMSQTEGPDGRTGHSTQKPVECMRRPIENNSSPGQAVYEPFSGSGTTIIAAEMTGRSVHAIELSPAYVDVAVRRWEEFTGQKATLERAS